MKRFQCSECGQINGHFTNCPEAASDERDDEPKVEAEPDDEEIDQ